jgi:hypothetical protein
MTDSELMFRSILKNQRAIMLSLMRICLDGKFVGCGASADDLRSRLIDMDRNFEWVSPPSQKMGELR